MRLLADMRRRTVMVSGSCRRGFGTCARRRRGLGCSRRCRVRRAGPAHPIGRGDSLCWIVAPGEACRGTVSRPVSSLASASSGWFETWMINRRPDSAVPRTARRRRACVRRTGSPRGAFEKGMLRVPIDIAGRSRFESSELDGLHQLRRHTSAGSADCSLCVSA